MARAAISCCAPPFRPSRWRTPFAPRSVLLIPCCRSATCRPWTTWWPGAKPRAASTPSSSRALPRLRSCWQCSAFTASLRFRSPLACRRWPSAWPGSQRSDIMRLVALSGLKLAAIGCVLGLAGAAATASILRSFLFHVSPFDPLVMILATVAVFVLALAASALPARRAASINPLGGVTRRVAPLTASLLSLDDVVGRAIRPPPCITTIGCLTTIPSRRTRGSPGIRRAATLVQAEKLF